MMDWWRLKLQDGNWADGLLVPTDSPEVFKFTITFTSQGLEAVKQLGLLVKPEEKVNG